MSQLHKSSILLSSYTYFSQLLTVPLTILNFPTIHFYIYLIPDEFGQFTNKPGVDIYLPVSRFTEDFDLIWNYSKIPSHLSILLSLEFPTPNNS